MNAERRIKFARPMPPSPFRRQAAPTHASDFAHHADGVARLNNGSFGSSPAPVLAADARARRAFRANPDALFFGDGAASLDEQLAEAARSAEVAMCAERGTVALVENATVAVASVANRWSKLIRPGDAVLLLDVCYVAVKIALKRTCEAARGELVFANVPWPGTTHAAVLESLEAELRNARPRFAVIDHISSQPALLMPVKEMVEMCRKHGVEEVCVDAAHALGQVDVDVRDIGADFYLSNLHKWAFSAGPVTALHCASVGLAARTDHPVPSWHAGLGVVRESRWAGTRDYAPTIAAPDALRYLDTWRSVDGLSAIEFNQHGVREALNLLCCAWGVEAAQADECVASMSMVRLPRELDKLAAADAPGKPSRSAGLRSTLRERYGIEAAVGSFKDAHGNPNGCVTRGSPPPRNDSGTKWHASTPARHSK